MEAEQKESKQDEVEMLMPNERLPINDSLFPAENLCFYVRNILSIAIPSMTSSLLNLIQAFTTYYFIGLLDNVKLLDAYSVAFNWSGIFVFSVIVGLASGMDTIISQSFGKQDYNHCGTVLYTGLLVVFLGFIPCSIFVAFSGSIFNYFGFDPVVSMYSQYCIFSFLPAYFIYIPVIILEKFMIGQRIAKPQMVFQIINTCLFPIYTYWFIFNFNLSIYGAPLAKCLSYLIYLCELLVYLKVSNCCSNTIVAPTSEAFKLWKMYLKIAFPSMLMIDLEWWAFSILSLFTAKLGVNALAANTIGNVYAGAVFMVCVGMGIGVCTLVGNSIGEKNARRAKRYALYGVIMTTIAIVALDLLGIILRKPLSGLLTSDKEVKDIMIELIFFVALIELFDGLQGTLGKILIGMGKQDYASIVNFFAYYFGMLPLGYIGCFYFGFGLYWIWISIAISSLIVACGFLFVICRTDWDKLIEARSAKQR